MNKPQALEFAEYLKCGGNYPPTLEDIAVELERQHGEIESMRAERLQTELRLLSAENKLLHERHHDDNVEYTRVLAQRDALLELLKLARSIIGHPDDAHTQMIDAAIKSVEENPHT